jgi:hypothetical protein
MLPGFSRTALDRAVASRISAREGEFMQAFVPTPQKNIP